MVSETSEKALEDLIEASLAAKADEVPTEYQIGDPKDFDRELALDTKLFWQFLEDTQGAKLDKLRTRHDWQRLVLERLDRKIKKDGILTVLKKGLSIDVPAGTFDVETLKAVLPDRTWTFHVERAAPHRLIKWACTTGEVGELIGVDRMKYWQLNRNGGEKALARFGLKARALRRP